MTTRALAVTSAFRRLFLFEDLEPFAFSDGRALLVLVKVDHVQPTMAHRVES